jgi:hypothetical protein
MVDGFNFFEWIPNIAIAGLALIILLAIWMVWRSIAPAAPGISLGYYEVVGRYAGQKLLRRIRGTLVDSTALFLSPEIESAFIKILKEDIKELKGNTADNDLENLLKSLDEGNVSLADYVKIIVTREKLFTKHAIIQYANVSSPLSAYAAYDPQSKFTLGFGFLVQGVITGKMHTLPQPWQIYKLGKVQVHLFKPDTLNPEELESQPPEYLAKLALYAPATVELKQVIKAKDDLLKEKERELIKAGHERSVNATRTDALFTAIQGFTTKFTPEELTGKGFDLMDFITIAFPTLLGYVIAEQLNTVPLVGVFLGLFIGAFFTFRRR